MKARSANVGNESLVSKADAALSVGPLSEPMIKNAIIKTAARANRSCESEIFRLPIEMRGLLSVSIYIALDCILQA